VPRTLGNMRVRVSLASLGAAQIEL